MTLLSAAERLTAGMNSTVRLERDRCLRSIDRRSTCAACQNLCPAGAIHAGSPPELDENACAGCLACLPACPVGAFSGDDAVGVLLENAAQAQTPSIELICEKHPRPGEGLAASALGLRVRGCLAGLGVGAYLALVAQGAERVVARAEACGGCRWGALQPRIEEQAQQAQQLLEALGRSEVVSTRVQPLETGVARGVRDTQSPPLSRRDLWRQLSRQGRAAVGRAWPADKASPPVRTPGHDRRRVIQAMAQLGSLTGGPLPAAVGESSSPSGCPGPGWATLAASTACTACGACARVCPTGALRLDHAAPDRFALNFIPRSCVGCEACVHVCAPAALTVDHAPAFQQVFGAAAVNTLCAGELGQCERCHAPMAVRPGETLCTVCAQRQLNPFGSHLPPGLRGKPDSAERRP